MNLYSVTLETIRRFAARRRLPRVVEKRIYVFILVPFDFRGNGHAKRSDIAGDLIEKRSDFDGTRNDGTLRLSGDRTPKSKTTGDQNDEPQLNFALMWTWF